MIQYFHRYCCSFKHALVVIPFSKGIELIRQSSFSHPFDELHFFYHKRLNAATHLFKLVCFCRAGVVASRYLNTNYDTSLISGMHILKEVCYMMTSFPAIHVLPYR